MKVNETIQYYDKNAVHYFNRTATSDLATQRQQFINHLHQQYPTLKTKDINILDLGCGSGRDSKQFLELGYQVCAIDGSASLAMMAQENIHKEVLHMNMLDLEFYNQFHGIWAMASMLHLENQEFSQVLAHNFNALKDKGIFYCSLKYGQGHIHNEGRYFNYFTEEKLLSMIKELQLNFQLLNPAEITKSVLNDSQEKWLNFYFQKHSS